ncbi:flagellar export chaperone FliS [Massilibacterium senegalense]|uniref:flagellar export chaperone FliS n=1 Tax=Massilibacterium senegalense TaxID=1632858 RepID=UPI0038995A05
MFRLAELITEEALYQKTPQEITALLYEAMLDHLENAIRKIETKDYVEVNESLKKCNDILKRLGAGLNYDAGIIADQLESVYMYVDNLLFDANVKKDAEKVKEAHKLISMISEAWHQAMINKETKANTRTHNMSTYDNLSAYED